MKRPPSVTAAIVVLSIMSFLFLYLIYIAAVNGAYASLILPAALLSILLVAILGLLTRKPWSRIVSVVLFALLAILMVVGNSNLSGTNQQRLGAVAYSIVIAGLLLWLIVSLLGKTARAYFSIESSE